MRALFEFRGLGGDVREWALLGPCAAMKATNTSLFMAGAACGALAMYLLGPGHGRRRRPLGRRSSWTDPSIPPSESSATRERDNWSGAQDDADQEN